MVFLVRGPQIPFACNKDRIEFFLVDPFDAWTVIVIRTIRSHTN